MYMQMQMCMSACAFVCFVPVHVYENVYVVAYALICVRVNRTVVSTRRHA